MARQIYNDTWASGGDKVDPGAVKTTLGWVVEAPPREHFNFYQGRTDEMLQDLERNGIIVYNAATIYDLGGYTREGTVTFRSLVVTNQGNLPSTSPTEWVQAFLIPGNNLSDLPSTATARTNLDVYSKAEADANFLDEASNLSDLPSTTTARTNLDVFSKTESNSNFLAIGAKAADSELLDGIDSTTFARQDQANTFTADQVIRRGSAASFLTLGADTGFDTSLRFQENSVTRGQVSYIESADEFRIFKLDTNGTTVKGQINLKNNGDVDIDIGTLKVSSSNLVIGTAGKGVDFDPAGSGAAANLLDDYEEGTFTPVAEGSTVAGVGTYTSQAGTYTKVGNLVSIQIDIGWTAHTGTGNLELTGIPFATGAARMAVVLGRILTLTSTADSTVRAFAEGSSTVIRFLDVSDTTGGETGTLLDTSVTLITLQATYRV